MIQRHFNILDENHQAKLSRYYGRKASLFEETLSKIKHGDRQVHYYPVELLDQFELISRGVLLGVPKENIWRHFFYSLQFGIA